MRHDQAWMAPGLLVDPQDSAFANPFIFIIAFNYNIQCIRIANQAVCFRGIDVLDTSDVTLAAAPRNFSTVGVQIRYDLRLLNTEENLFICLKISHTGRVMLSIIINWLANVEFN